MAGSVDAVGVQNQSVDRGDDDKFPEKTGHDEGVPARNYIYRIELRGEREEGKWDN